MKKIIIYSLTVICIVFSMLVLTSFNTPEEDIIGTWVSNDDVLWKMSFDENGEREDYYENVLNGKYAYYISDSCNGQTLQDEIFLISIDATLDKTCDILNGFHEDSNGVITLSITTERGKLYLFTKE